MKRLVRYGLVGVTISLAYAGLVSLLVSFAHLQPVLASVAAFLMVLPASWLGHSRVTFGDRDGSSRGKLKFVVTSVSTFLIAPLSMYIATGVLKQPYWVGIAIMWVLIPIMNFGTMSLWVFSNPRANLPASIEIKHHD